MTDQLDPDTIEAVLDGYARHDGATLIAFRDGAAFGVVRIADRDALAGVPAELFASGSYDEVNTAVAALGIDHSAAAQEDRPDGTSFIAVDAVMYTLARLGDARYGLLELTDHDFIEGEFAQLVFKADDLVEARGAFSFAVANRRAGRAPIAGRL